MPLDDAAVNIMSQASDFIVKVGTEDVIHRKQALPDVDYQAYGVITRADVVHEYDESNAKTSEYIVSPFIVYTDTIPRAPTNLRNKQVDRIVYLVKTAIGGGAVATVNVQDHHGDPRNPLKWIGREQKHQPGNPHGNTFG